MSDRPAQMPLILRTAPRDVRAQGRAPLGVGRAGDGPGGRIAARARWALAVIARHVPAGPATLDGEERVFLHAPPESADVPPGSSPPTAPAPYPLAAPARVLERIIHRTIDRVVIRTQPGRSDRAVAARVDRARKYRPHGARHLLRAACAGSTDRTSPPESPPALPRRRESLPRRREPLPRRRESLRNPHESSICHPHTGLPQWEDIPLPVTHPREGEVVRESSWGVSRPDHLRSGRPGPTSS